MNKPVLRLIGALCCFGAAALNVYAGNQNWIAGLLVFSGVLLIISYFSERGRG